MSSIDTKTIEPAESLVNGHDVKLKGDAPQADWTPQEEKKAKLRLVPLRIGSLEKHY